jgi:ElaA protein
VSDVTWRYEPFARLTSDELYRIVCLREREFVVEQTCPYRDADGIDPACDHLWTCGADGAVLAYLRVVPGGAKYDEPSLGRIVTAPEARRTGLGRALVIEGLARARARFGEVPLRIGAQKYLERFYGSFGFVRASDDYVEDGIPHVEMLIGGAALH